MELGDSDPQTAAAPRHRRLIRALLVTGATVLSVWAIALLVDPVSIGQTLAAADLGAASAAVLCMLAYQLCRAYRLRVLHGAVPGSIAPLFAGVTFQGAANMALPGGLGEIALVWVVRRLIGRSVLRSVATVFLARLFDSLVLGAAAAAAVLILLNRLPPVVVLPTLALLVVVAILAGASIYMALRPVARRPSQTTRWRRALRKTTLAFRRSIRSLLSWRKFMEVTILSAALWLFFFGTYYFVSNSFSLQISLSDLIVVYVLSFPINVFPIRTVGNIGIFEGVWVVILVALGRSPEASLATAVSMHVGLLGVVVASTLIVGLGSVAALIWPRLLSRKAKMA